MRHNDFPDTTSEQLLQSWQEVGVAQRGEIRSHRAPRRQLRRSTQVRLVFGLVTIAALGTVSNSVPIDTSRTRSSSVITAPRLLTNTDGLTPSPLLSTSPPLTKQDDTDRRLQSIEAATRKERISGKQAIPTPTPKKTPIIRWVKPLASYKVTSCYGQRWGRLHAGIDMSAPSGTPIRAVGAGKVVQAGWRYTGMGNSVVIDHGNGQMTIYAHASRVLVRSNQRVSAGAVIALVGSTGDSTGPHLHIALSRAYRVGDVITNIQNPTKWLKDRNIPVGNC